MRMMTTKECSMFTKISKVVFMIGVIISAFDTLDKGDHSYTAW